MKKYILFFSYIVSCVLPLFAGTNPIVLLPDECDPSQDSQVASLSKLTLKFDLSAVYAAHPDIAQNDFGICASMDENCCIIIYEGDADTGTILTKNITNVGYRSSTFAPGKTEITIELDKEYLLTSGQKYTVYIPATAFYTRTKKVNTSSETHIVDSYLTFYGKDLESTQLVLVGENPIRESELSSLNILELSFNSDVTLVSEANADLYEGDNLIKSVPLSIKDGDAKIVVANFDDEKLYNSHTYAVKISDNCIFANGGSNGYGEIELHYKGLSYNYLSYGRISPRQGEVNYLATINVPIVCETGYGLGRAKAPTVYLYKEGVEEPIQTVKCTLGIDGKSWEIPFYNFNLDPSSTYNVVMPAHQFSIWKTLESGGYNEVKDTSNPELTLTYTTPAEITLPDPIQFGTSDPANGTSLEKLEKIKVNFDRYSFDEQSYYPYFASSTLEAGWNIVHLYKDGSEEPIADIEVDVKWDDNNNYWLESVNPINATLYEGQNYKVVIPAGMFIASEEKLAPISANKEYEIALQGATPTVSALGLAFDNAGLVASAIGVVSFSTADEVTVAADAKMQLLNREEPAAETAIYVAHEGEKYRAYADFGNFKLAEGTEYTVVLPAASLYAADGIVNNEQMTATVSGIPVVVVPTYKNVDLTVNGCVKSQYVVETGKSVEVEVYPLNTDWELATLTLDGTDVTEAVVDGKYVVESVEADLDLAAEFAYAHEITYDYTSGIDAPYDSPYSVRSEGGNLVISGVQGGDTITVYSVNGMKMSNLPAVPDGKTEVSISLQTGNVYIVLINNVSLKIQH